MTTKVSDGIDCADEVICKAVTTHADSIIVERTLKHDLFIIFIAAPGASLWSKIVTGSKTAKFQNN